MEFGLIKMSKIRCFQKGSGKKLQLSLIGQSLWSVHVVWCIAKPFVMYNHIWQNLLLCTTNHILKHPSRSMGLQFVPINWQTLCLLFQLFATIKAMLVVDLETNIWALLLAGSACCLPDFIFLVWSLTKHEGNTKVGLTKAELVPCMIQ